MRCILSIPIFPLHCFILRLTITPLSHRFLNSLKPLKYFLLRLIFTPMRIRFSIKELYLKSFYLILIINPLIKKLSKNTKSLGIMFFRFTFTDFISRISIIFYPLFSFLKIHVDVLKHLQFYLFLAFFYLLF